MKPLSLPVSGKTGRTSDMDSLRRLWALAGPLRGKVVLGIVFRFAQSASLGLAFGVVIWILGDLAAAQTPSRTRILEASGLMALSLAGQLLFGYLSVSNSWVASYELAGGLRLALLAHLRALPMSFHLSRHRGDTVTTLTTDMKMLESFMSEALPRIAQAFGLPVVTLSFMLWRDPVTGLAALASVILSMPVFLWASRRLAALGVRRQDMQAEAGARMIEHVQGIAVTRAFNRIAAGQESYGKALADFRDVSKRIVLLLVTPLVAFGAVLMAGLPLLVFTAGLRLLNGQIDLTAFVAALVLSFSVYSPLLGLIGVMELARLAEASLNRIDRIATQTPAERPAIPREPQGFAVEFDGVHFGYHPQTPVLKGVTFTAPERSMTAIVGPSGAGKSTILNLLPRFFDINAGAIRIGGVDIREIDPERLNALITVVFQDVYLFAGTIFDNIAMGREGADMAAVEAAARSAQAHDFICALPEGYETRVGEGGANLSGGERQRISIARAMLKNAPIVLLDEVTAAVDASTDRLLRVALSDLVYEKTLLVVAHKLSTIRTAGQILVLDGGVVSEHGTHSVLLASGGRYSRLWASLLRAARWDLGHVQPD